MSDVLVRAEVEMCAATREIDLFTVNNHPPLNRFLGSEVCVRDIDLPYLVPAHWPPDRDPVAWRRWDEAVVAAGCGRAVALVVLHEGEVEVELELVDEVAIEAGDQLGESDVAFREGEREGGGGVGDEAGEDGIGAGVEGGGVVVIGDEGGTVEEADEGEGDD